MRKISALRAAGNLQVDQGLSGYRHAARSGQGAAVVVQIIAGCGINAAADGLSRLVRILAQWRRQYLVGIKNAGQMRALAAYVGNRRHRAPQNFMLNIEVPLLHVRPHRLVGN